MARDVQTIEKNGAHTRLRGIATMLLMVFGFLVVTAVSAQNSTTNAGGKAGSEIKPKETAPPAPKTAEEKPVEETEKATDKEEVIKLLGDKGLEVFYPWIEGAGVFADTKGIFSFEDNVLRISGERVGYLATREQHSDFRLVAEYKWGQTKFGDRTEKPRNSGLLIHGTGEDKEWMRGFECQIAEGRTGNVVIHNGARFTMGTNSYSKSWTEVGKSTQELELKHGEWNTLEVFAVGDKLRVLINGKPTVEGTSLSPNRGRILLQSNGAEIFFRRLDIYPLEKMPEAPTATAAVSPDPKKAGNQP
jgi:hypothetical protein